MKSGEAVEGTVQNLTREIINETRSRTRINGFGLEPRLILGTMLGPQYAIETYSGLVLVEMYRALFEHTGSVL